MFQFGCGQGAKLLLKPDVRQRADGLHIGDRVGVEERK
jgi:hypothetical protein